MGVFTCDLTFTSANMTNLVKVVLVLTLPIVLMFVFHLIIDDKCVEQMCDRCWYIWLSHYAMHHTLADATFSL